MKLLGEKVVKNVRIVTLSDVPPGFLLRPKVIAAIRKEVLHDLRKKGLKRVPAGTEVDYGYNFIGRLIRKIRGNHGV